MSIGINLLYFDTLGDERSNWVGLVMKMKFRTIIATTAIAVCLAGATSAQAATIAYEVQSGTAGNQSFPGVLGMDFEVNSAINVLSLGAFDDTRNGVNGISAGTTLTT